MLGQESEELAEDDFADAIPASAVTEGMTVLIDDGEGNERAATVFAVTVIRDKDTGDVTETTLTFNGTGRVKNHITYGASRGGDLARTRQNPHTRLSLYATSIGEPMPNNNIPSERRDNPTARIALGDLLGHTGAPALLWTGPPTDAGD